MNILVTGATGFLGTHLCNQLETQGHSLIRLGSKQCDLTQQGSLHIFDQQQFDQIWHLAAWTQAGDFCLYHPGEQWIINQQINTNVLTWWQTKQPHAKLIAIGTSCAYAPDRPLVEEQYMDGLPIESLFTYAMTKRMLYAGLLALQKQYQLRYLCVVPSTLYGPGYHTDGRQMHFIFDLIRKIIRGKLYGETVALWGDGYQRRELVYVDDFVNIVLSLAKHVDNDLVNIGAGEEYTIRQFAQQICEIVDYDFSLIQFDTTKYVGAKSKILDIAKLNKLMPGPGIELTPLHDGLKKTIAWFLSERSRLLPSPH